MHLYIKADDALNIKHPFLSTFVCLHTTPHHRSTQLHEQADGCVQWIIVSRVLFEETMYIRSSENLDDCFCGWQLSGYIALMNITNHSCHHSTSLSWFTFVSLVFPKDMAEFQRRYLLCHLPECNVSICQYTCCAICRNVMSVYSLRSHIHDNGLDGHMDPWKDVLVDSINPEKRDVRQVTVEYVSFRKCKQLQ
jgi:hypothetical protein